MPVSAKNRIFSFGRNSIFQSADADILDIIDMQKNHNIRCY